MDYNDNDYESQNLHLAGEESSKLPSSLRPFVLPKFDFDDNLHGNLRFDSLVDNEVFLGIPSQDDNQWIEDFSRGSNGIRFCSTSTVSCALSRCNNVWSEATSSESVEMLLKSVGQEEMVQGESMVKESDMHDHPSSTAQMGTNLRSGDKTDDIDSINPLLPPVEADQNLSVPDQSAVDQAVCHEHSSDAAEQNLSASGVRIGDKDNSIVTSCINLDNENRKTCHESVSNSSSEQVQKSFPFSDPGSENLENTHEKHAGMLGKQDKISDISYTRSSGVEYDKLNTDVNTDDEILNDSTVQTDSQLQCSVEERIVAVQVNTFGGSMPEMGESVSSVEDRGNVDIAPAVGSGCGSAAVDPILGIKQLSEGHILSFDIPSISSQGDGCAYGSGNMPEISVDVELDQDPVAQLSMQPEGDAVKDLYPSNPPAQNSKSDINHAGLPCNSQDSSFAGPQNSGIEGMREVMQAATVHKESLKDEDDASPPLLDGDAQTRGLEGDDNLSMQVDSQGGDLDVSHTRGEDSLSVQVDDSVSMPAGDFDVIACEKDGQKPLDDCNVTCDANRKAAGLGFAGNEGEVNVEIAAGLQSNASAGDDCALIGKVGDEKVKSFCHEDKQLADSHEQNVPTLDADDQNKDLEPTKQQITPSSVESLAVVTEGATTGELERNSVLDSVAAGGTEMDNPSVSLVDESYSTVPAEVTEELFEKAEHPTSDLAEQITVSEAEKSLKTKTERIRVTNSSKASESRSFAEIEESGHHGASPINRSGPPQVDLKEKESVESKPRKVSDGLSTSTDSGIDTLKQDDTFTFDIRPLESKSTEVSAKAFQEVPGTQAVLPLSGEGLPSVSGKSQKDTMIIKEVSQPTSVLPSGGPSPPEGLKGSSARKPRRRNSKSGKESAKTKRGNLAKDTTLPQQTERFDKSATFMSPLAAGQLMSFDSAVKTTVGVSVSAPSLPDLNSAGPSSVAFHQPFTDLQQVQLRAQIFVYGSLIQGGAPDEACMISAFGISGGGRSTWEPSWRACVERRHGSKNQENKSETPLQSRTGVPKAADQTSTKGFSYSEVISTPTGRASDKAAPSPLVSPIIPLSSPLWNMPTPGLPSSSMTRFEYPSGSPLPPYQTPPPRNFMAHTTTWPSHPPYPVPWLASSKVPFDIHSNYSASLITEPVRLTPVKESSQRIAPQEKHLPIPAINTAATTVFAGTPTFMDMKKVPSQTSAVTKTRKRKKSSGSGADAVHIPVTAPPVDTVSTPLAANHLNQKVPAVEGFNQSSMTTQNQADTVPTTTTTTTTIVSCHHSTPVSVPAATFMPSHIFSTMSPSISSDQQRGGVDKRALDLESFNKVEEAKIQAEQAAALAAEAVNHCQGVWNKLDQQRNLGLTTDAEAKLASASVAIAAAAAVAKAAAAAAKIASSAAMQAKQMAEEAVATHRSVNTPGYNTGFVFSSENTPVSTFWNGDSNNASTLAISAAREAAKKRVEAASTASRHAESLDAIVRAAELAAEAVSHTGKIVGITDPFSLNQLVKSGPDDYWKAPNMATGPVEFTGGNAEVIPNVSKNVNDRPDKDVHNTSHIGLPVQTDLLNHTRNDNMDAEENLISSFKHGGLSSKSKKDKTVLEPADVISMVPESDTELRSSSFIPSYESNGSIKEGSAVEVFKEFDNKRAWFSAKVLSLKDNKALVSYMELQADEGSEQQQEWVPLEALGGKAPIVRISHPMTGMQFEGTKKRRRAAIKDYDWSVGDRVDAWVKDCWREGLITDMNKKDPTSLTVHFPVEEETITVKMWHLRPTLLWSDGQWSECCRAGDNGTSQGDTPVEKRAKLGGRGLESKVKGKIDEKTGFAEGRRIEEPNLPLSASENVFNIGITKEDSRTMRSGLQKEGPRTIFGVPKPGKKRKFMDVSKHYVSEKNKKTTATVKDPVPLAFGTRSSRRVDVKEKQIPESKPRPVKSGKPPGVPTRTLLRKGDSTPSRPNSSDAASTEQFVRGSSSNDDNESGEQIINEIGSFSHVEDNSRGTFVFSSQAVPTESLKKAPVRMAKPDRLNKGKLPPSAKLAKTGTHEGSIPEASEPRRSNRRIQPTSRLLEGLQSSLIIPKFPSSHDKGQRSQRGTPRGNDNRS